MALIRIGIICWISYASGGDAALMLINVGGRVRFLTWRKSRCRRLCDEALFPETCRRPI
jgi:hypothetical protein